MPPAALTDLFDPQFLERLESLQIACRRAGWGTRTGGRYTVNRRGSSVEFAEYNEYTWGDDFRTIDWNLYGRLEKLFVKTYKDDIELQLQVLLDATGSMAHPSQDGKFDYARRLANTLTYIGLANRNIVRAGVIGGSAARTMRVSPWMQHRHGIFALAKLLAASPQGQPSLSRWVESYIAAFKPRGGVLVLISDWMVAPQEWARALQLLQARHLELRVIQVLGELESQPGRWWKSGLVVDSETRQQRSLAAEGWDLQRYVEALQRHNERLELFCRRAGITFVRTTTATPVETFVLRDLPRLRLITGK